MQFHFVSSESRCDSSLHTVSLVPVISTSIYYSSLDDPKTESTWVHCQSGSIMCPLNWTLDILHSESLTMAGCALSLYAIWLLFQLIQYLYTLHLKIRKPNQLESTASQHNVSFKSVDTWYSTALWVTHCSTLAAKDLAKDYWMPFKLKAFYCTARGCKKRCSTPSGLQWHVQTIHEVPRALLHPSMLTRIPPSNLSQPLEEDRAPFLDASHHQSLRGSPIYASQTLGSHPHHLKIMTHLILDGTIRFSAKFVYNCWHPLRDTLRCGWVSLASWLRPTSHQWANWLLPFQE